MNETGRVSRSLSGHPSSVTLGQRPSSTTTPYRAATVARGLCLIALIACACGDAGRERATTTVAELARELPFSRRTVELAELDLGAAGSSAWLTDGWSHLEQTETGTGFRWALGESSGVRFDLLSSRELELQFTARSFAFPAEAAQVVEVLVNGVSVDALPMTTSWASYSLTMPATVLRAGPNELRFRYRQWLRPAERAGATSRGPTRRLAVAWQQIRFPNARPAVAEMVTLKNGSALFVPTGARVDFFLDVPAGSALRLDAARPRGDPGRLLVTETGDERAESTLFESESALGRSDAPLLGGEAGVVRLSVTLATDADPREGDGFVLERPRIVAEVHAPDPPTETGVPATRLARRPNVLIYLVDTLRTDAVGAYGSDRDTSPAFDRFVEDATLYEHAVGQSSWTRASVASVFTGLLPTRHGAIDRLDILSIDALTLPELLNDAGYETAAFITNPNVTGKFGFSQGFEEFVHIRTYRASDEVNQRVFGWLDQRASDRPFFLYVHTMDPHHPYLPPEPLRPSFALTEADMRAVNRLLSTTPAPSDLVRHVDRLRALYDGAARFNDRSFGELVDYLETAELLDETVVLFLSDHGEEFFEHGDWQHGKNLHAETLNVPLAVRFPDAGRGVRVRTIIGHVDLLPTLFDYLKLETPTALDGRSVLASSLDQKRSEAVSGRAFAHLSLDGHESVAVVDGEWKLILARTNRGTRLPHLYRWTTDPEERNDLADEKPIRVDYLQSLIARSEASDRPPLEREEAELDPELERSLKALGYLK